MFKIGTRALLVAAVMSLSGGYANAQGSADDAAADTTTTTATEETASGEEAGAAGEEAVPAEEAGTAEETVPAGEAVPASEAAPVEHSSAGAGYKKGFFITSDDGNFALHTQGRVQGRFVGASQEGADGRDEEAYFQLSRVRLTLGGHAFAKNIKYKFQTDFAKGAVNLKDFFVDYGLGDTIKLRVGQYKLPFSRQELTSSGRQELVDRAITAKAFGGGRDIGVALHNNYEKSPDFEWAVGVFNGQAADKPDPDTGKNYPALFGPALALRVGINRGGIKGYSEADLEGGPMRFAVGASVVADFDADDDNDGAVVTEADFIMKNQGMSVSGSVFVSMLEGADGFFDQSRDQLGFHTQLGYMVTDKHQVAARYALVNKPDLVDPNTNINDQEIVVGYSIYSFKHNFKWQTDVSLLAVNGASFGDDVALRSQLQLSF